MRIISDKTKSLVHVNWNGKKTVIKQLVDRFNNIFCDNKATDQREKKKGKDAFTVSFEPEMQYD